MAILIDRSYSMRQEAAGVDLFAKAKLAAGDIISLLKDGDELFIVPFDDAPAPITPKPTRLLADAHETVDNLSPSDAGTDIWTSIAFASGALDKSRLLHKEIYILTDNKATGFRRPGELRLSDDKRLYAIVFEPDDERNIGVTEIEFPPSLLQSRVPFEISAQAHNFSAGAVSDYLVDLYIDSNRVARRSFDLNPGTSATIRLKSEVESGGFHGGWVASEGDALPADNVRFFSFKIPKRLDVLIVGGSEAGFIEKALSPGMEDFFAVKGINYRRLGGEMLSDFDLIVLSDPPALSSAIAASIDGFVRSGGGLLLFMGGSPDPRKSAEALFGEDSRFEVLAAIGDTTGPGRLYLGDADFDHPVFMAYSGIGLPEVAFRRIAAIERAPSVLLTFSNGLPAIAEGDLGDGKIGLCGFSTDLGMGGLSTSGFFAPILHRLSQYLCSDIAAFDPGYTVGDRVVRTVTSFPGAAGAIRIVCPDGGSSFLTPRFVGGKAILDPGALRKAGIYRIYADTTLVDLFAVNVDPSESDPAKLDRSAVDRMAPITWISPDDNLAEKVLSARYGREIHHGMLVLALLFMVIELALGSTWRRPRDLSEDIK